MTIRFTLTLTTEGSAPGTARHQSRRGRWCDTDAITTALSLQRPDLPREHEKAGVSEPLR